jgi:putative lipoprotein
VDAVTSVAGIVTYRQRIALPAGSVVRVQLEDVSRAAAPAVVLAESKIVTTGEQVPIPFALEPGQPLEPRLRYALRASIEIAGEIRFATRSELRPAEDALELVVEPASSGTPSLDGTRWVLVELYGEPVEAGEGAPYLVFDTEERRVAGSGGCNRLTGTFETAGGELRFGPIATTLMAGPEPVMERESAFLAALAATTGLELQKGELALLGDDGVRARLAAADG